MTESDKRDHSNSRDPAPLAIDATGIVDRDTPCRRCGYNLRGLNVDGQCPECGGPVELSTGDDRLTAANPRWLRQLSRAIVVLVISSFLIPITSCTMGYAAFDAVWEGDDISFLGAASMVALIAACIAWIAAVWCFTQRDRPHVIDRASARAARRARVSALVAVTLITVIVATVGTALLFVVRAGLDVLIVAIGLTTGLSLLIAWEALLRWCQHLATRGKARGFARFVANVRNVLIVCGAIVLCYALLCAFVELAGRTLGLGTAPREALEAPGAVLGVMAVTASIGLAALALFTFGILILILDLLDTSRNEAIRNWSGDQN